MTLERDKFRLMIIMPTMKGGGIERFISVLLKHLDYKVFDPELTLIFEGKPFHEMLNTKIHILEQHPQPQAEGSLIQLFGDMGIKYQDELNWLEATAYKLAVFIRKQQPDIILALGFFASTIILIAKQYIPKGIKIIGSSHGHCSTHFSMIQQGDLYAALIRRYFKEADLIVAISHSVAQDLIENFGLPSALVTVIYNPIDLKHIEILAKEPVTEHHWFDEEVPILLFVGSLSAEKGLEYLLQGITLARKLEKFRCVIVGDGEKRPELETLVAQLKLTEDVIFLGRQKNPFKFMRHAVSLIIPSIVEGLSYVALEAMACGCPIIATDRVPAARELLGEDNCLIVPAKDPYALAEAILKILWNVDLRERFSQVGLQRAKEFAAEKIVAQYEALLKAHVIS